MRIDSFGDSKTDNFFRGDEDGGKNIPEGSLGMRMKFYSPPYINYVPEHFIKITFIGVYLNTYMLYLFIFSQNVHNLFLCDVYYYHNSR
jgi:hypothetical protein